MKRRCLVLGGSGALGRVVCRMLSQHDIDLVLTYNTREEDAHALAAEIGARAALQLDLAAERAPARTVELAAQRLGGLDILVSCAGVALTVPGASANRPQQLAQIDAAAWDRMSAVNVRGIFFACQQAIAEMGDGGGDLVLVGSIDMIKTVPSPVHYSAAKGALGALARALSKEVGRRGIRVNVVAPGLLEDGMGADLPAELRDAYLKHCGLRRVGRISEVAEVVQFFALENTYVTGQIIPVDGGL